MKKLLFVGIVGALLLSSTYFTSTQKIDSRHLLKSNETAGVLGYTTSNLDYIYDYQCNQETISGSTYKYHSAQLWTAYYKYYSPVSDSLFFFVFGRNRMTTNDNKLANGYYRIVARSSKITYGIGMYSLGAHVDMDDLDFIKYFPEEYGTTNTSNSASFTLGVTANLSTIGVSLSSCFSNGVTTSTVIMTGTTNNSATNKTATLNYQTQDAWKKALNNKAPYRGDFITYSGAVYEVKNYSQHIGERVDFYVHTETTSQKFTVGAKVCTGYDQKTLTQTKKISVTL